ncbi:MAG: DNA mismatch repair endonuclease MutL [Rickettsiales bacterium]|jgi:DNA mismatch repair protein MutL|nr:DNA mismatch repair endonuclease MutL [Rickettsiales bacterium]
MPIQKLPNILINQIAAGEVIERPASVVKELIENSIDANAKNIEIIISAGGKNLIKIIDDGDGVAKEEFALMFERHATSKLSGKNLLNIITLGFRGEGLASIASIANIRLTSKIASDKAYSYEINGGTAGKVQEANLSKGTIIEVRDLFCTVPARLKFLKADKYEASLITALVNQIALSNPDISFNLSIDDKQKLKYRTLNLDEHFDNRYADIIGSDFVENSYKLDYAEDDIKVQGRISFPNFNRGSSDKQFFYINKRPVKDKIFQAALRSSYFDFLPRDRHPVCLIFLEIPNYEIDINVHPSKTEIRFRDGEKVKKILKTAFKEKLKNNDFSFNQNSFDQMKSMVNKNKIFHHQKYNEKSAQLDISKLDNLSSSGSGTQAFAYPSAASVNSQPSSPSFELNQDPKFRTFEASGQDLGSDNVDNTSHSLGAAICQVHNTYIIAQTEEGMVIVDQHAAHERINYEKSKNITEGNVKTQTHLIAEIVELSEIEIAKLLEFRDQLAELGLKFEKFGIKAVAIKESPDFLSGCDFVTFLKDLAESIIENNDIILMQDKFKEHYGNIACRYSIRSGRQLSVDEMNHILRSMEQTSHTSTCNHGRPTYIKLKLSDIEKLFERL